MSGVPSTRMPAVLRNFCIGSVALTLIAVLARLVCQHIGGLDHYPYNHYALPHDGDGIDLMIFYQRFQHFHSPEFFSPNGGSVYAYPAAVAPFYWLFYRVRHPVYPFLAGSVAILLWLGYRLAKAMEHRGLEKRTALGFVAVALLFSYPLYFEFSHCNLEFVMWLVGAAGVYAVLRDRPWLGAVLLGLATAMKLYPFVFVGLLLSRRKYGPAVLLFASAAIFSFVSLWLICPDVAFSWRSINAGVALFQKTYTLQYWKLFIGIDHSLFALIKRALGILPAERYAKILRVYMLVCACGGIALYLARIRKLPVINQVLALTVAMVLLPPLSFDYTLVQLYTPFAMLCLLAVEAWRAQKPVPGLGAVFVCLTMLLAQVGEVIVHSERLGGQIKAVALLVLFVLAVWFKFPSSLDRSEPIPQPLNRTL